jgi:putative ABC transport system permease protein
MVQGNALIEGGGRQRRVTVYGVGPDVPEVLRFRPAVGSFLPRESDPNAARPLAVVGAKVRSELFAGQSPLGEKIRIGGQRYRVVGVVEPKGQILGFDLDDAVHIPAARALELFNREGLMEINVLYAESAPLDEVVESIRRLMETRLGREDFTIITQK